MRISDYEKELKKLYAELFEMQAGLNSQKKSFNFPIQPRARAIQAKVMEIYRLQEKTFPVALKDVVDELAKLSELSKNQIQITAYTNCHYKSTEGPLTKKEVLAKCEANKKSETLTNFLTVSIGTRPAVKGSKAFWFTFSYPLSLKSKTSNGKRLIDIATLKSLKTKMGTITSVEFDPTPAELIVFPFTLAHLIEGKEDNCTNPELIKQAVENCLAKQKEEKAREI